MIGNVSYRPSKQPLPIMSKQSKSRRRYPEWENTCNYCLYLQPTPGSPGAGNCTYHRQWIRRSALTTCSDMSAQPLAEGIYTLSDNAYGAWSYHRRREHVRTRLFLLQGARGNPTTGETEKQPPAKKRMN